MKSLRSSVGSCIALTLCAGVASAAEKPLPLRADQVQLSHDRILRVEASSTSASTLDGRPVYRAAQVADGRDWSAWGSVPSDGPGAWLQIAFQNVQYIDRLDFVPGDEREAASYNRCGRPARLRIDGDGQVRTIDLQDRRWQQVVMVDPPLAASAIRLTFESVYGKASNAGVCVSELKFAGPANPLVAFPDLNRRIDEAIGYLADDQRFDRGRKALLAIGPPALPQIVAALSPQNPHLTARALEVLGRIGDPAQIATVQPFADSSEPAIRTAALSTLGALRDPSAYDRIRQWYDGAAGAEKDRAFDALSLLGDMRSVDVVTAELLGGNPARRESAEDNLGRLGAGAVQALKPLLASTVVFERTAALRALGGVDQPDARDILMRTLISAPESELRAAAIQGLARRADPAAHDAILARASSRYQDERQAAAWALGRFAQSEDLATLEEMTSDLSMSVRESAANALGNLGTAALPVLRRLAVIGPDGATAEAAARALLNIERTPETAVKLLASRHHPTRAIAARTLRELGPVGVSALLDAAVAPEDATRTAALAELKQAGAAALPVLLERAEAASSSAHADILRFAANLKDRQAVGLAAKLLGKSPDLVVRRQAVETLSACGDADSAGPALVAALGDKAVEVRFAAIEAIGHLRVTGAAPAVAALIKDAPRNIVRAAVVTLGQLRDESALEALLSLYRVKSGADQDDPMLRQEIVASVALIGGDGSLPVLMDAATDKDAHVRFAAQDSLR